MVLGSLIVELVRSGKDQIQSQKGNKAALHALLLECTKNIELLRALKLEAKVDHQHPAYDFVAQ